MKILAYSALNSVTQNTIKTLVFRKNTQDIQQVRKNMAAVLTAPAKNSRPEGRFFCILGLLMRTHDKVVRPQTKGRRQYAGERKRMSVVAAKPILLPLPLKMKTLKSVFFLYKTSA